MTFSDIVIWLHGAVCGALIMLVALVIIYGGGNGPHRPA